MVFRTGSRFDGNDGVVSYSRVNWNWLVLTLAVVGLIAMACGGGNESAPAASTGSGAETKLSGNIEIDGSSTVFPISQAAAEEFRKEQPKVQIRSAFPAPAVASSGSPLVRPISPTHPAPSRTRNGNRRPRTASSSSNSRSRSTACLSW